MAEKYRNRIMRSSGISKRKVKSDYGERIMKMMGWTGETGLGKDGEGRVDPVQVGRLEDFEGVRKNTKNFKTSIENF